MTQECEEDPIENPTREDLKIGTTIQSKETHNIYKVTRINENYIVAKCIHYGGVPHKFRVGDIWRPLIQSALKRCIVLT